MRFFHLPKRDRKRFEEDPPMLRAVRALVIAILFCGVGLGIWLNAGRQAAIAEKQAAKVIDATASLSAEQQRQLSDYAEKFLATYGISIVIRIQNEGFSKEVLPEAKKAATLFLGISLGTRQTRLEVPPLAAVSLGDACIEYLRHEHFEPYFARDAWQEGLVAALNLLTKQLDQALPGQGGAMRRPAHP